MAKADVLCVQQPTVHPGPPAPGLAACRLLGSFQSSLDEITIIALPESNEAANGDAAANGGFGGAGGTQQRQRAVQIQSFFDPAKGVWVRACCYLRIVCSCIHAGNAHISML